MDNRWKNLNQNLSEIKRSIIKQPHFNISRKKEIITNILRIRHSYLAQNYLMAKEDQTMCSTCGTSITVKHLLTECFKYRETIRDLEIPNLSQESLRPREENIINKIHFLKKSELYNSI